MKFVFVYERFIIGGIETLIVRMHNWLNDNGHEAKVVLGEGGELVSSLPSENTLILGSSRFHALSLAMPLKKRERDFIKNADFVMAFSRPSLMVGITLMSRIKGSKILCGVFSPWTFLYNKFPNNNKLNSSFFNSNIFNYKIPDSNKIFMSLYIRNIHEDNFSRSMYDSIPWPLPIIENMYKFNYRPDNYRIVSIGRLTKFKTYNLYMIDIVKNLRLKGFNVIWDVYGDEDNSDISIKKQMIDRIDKNNMNDIINLKGAIKYEAIHDALEGAVCFLGMGTSVVNAASCGIPSVVCIAECDEALTYGFLHEHGLGSLGESILGRVPDKNVETLLIDFFRISASDKNNISVNEFNYSKQYLVDRRMTDFIKICGKANFSQGVIFSINRFFYIIFKSIMLLWNKFRG